MSSQDGRSQVCVQQKLEGSDPDRRKYYDKNLSGGKATAWGVSSWLIWEDEGHG